METQNALEHQNVFRDDYDKDHIALACKNIGSQSDLYYQSNTAWIVI